jgi:hypothetical protein
MVDFSRLRKERDERRKKEELQEPKSPEATEPFSLEAEGIEKSRKEFGATIPIAIKRLMGETTAEWVERCYENDQRFVKVTANFFGSMQTAPMGEEITSDDFYFNGRLLTHKAPCPSCKVDNYIDWFKYPDERNPKLGCVECMTIIDVYKAYNVKK